MTVLVAFDASAEGVWETLKEEAFGAAVPAEWHDPTVGVHFAHAPAVLPSLGPRPTESLFIDDHFVVAMDGRLVPPSTDACDAERIVAAYRRRAIACARGLAGSFAFVLWDRVRRRLLAGCDVTGQRTLAYARPGVGLVLSSRALALLRHPRVASRLDEVYLAHALCDTWAQLPGSSAFTAIRRIRPGWALSMSGGRCAEERVDCLRPSPPSNRVLPVSDYVETFWQTLDQAVRDATEPKCTGVELSSGLDSTTVALSSLRIADSVEAFSVVAEAASGADERKLIHGFVSNTPGIRWHTVDCGSDPLAIVEPWEGSPIPDDPGIQAVSFLPARLSLARCARKLGCTVLLDGEGGDELFGMSPRLGDLVAEGSWRSAVEYMRGRGWKSSLMRELLVPYFSAAALHAWAARERRKRDPIPVWLSERFRRSEATRSAFRQREDWLQYRRSEQGLAALLEVAPNVGSRQAVQMLLAATGIETRSPLLDRRVVELTLGIPARIRLDAPRSKIFLRRALEGRAPADLVTQPKNNRLYQWMQVQGLRGPWVGEACRSLETIPVLHGRVRGAILREVVDRVARDEPVPMWTLEQLYGVLCVGAWVGRLGATMGIAVYV